MNLSTKYGCRKQTYDYCGDKGVVDWETGIDICTPTIYKVDNQQGPNVKHKELYSVFYNNLYEERI